MCGRYQLHTSPAAWVTALLPGIDVTQLPPLRARYNIAPTQDVPAIVQRSRPATPEPASPGVVIDLPDRTHIRELALLRWGLLPAWAKDRSIGASMINARSETAHEKVSFRQPLASRRCLLPADGYYEWQRAGKTKQPFHIHGTRGEILWFAGLWESNSKLGADQQPLRSCTILTQAASETLAPIHDRMPVLVDPALHEVWLSEETDGRALLERLIEVGSETRLAADPISSYVNNARHEGPQCLTPPLDNTCEDTRPGEAPRT